MTGDINADDIHDITELADRLRDLGHASSLLCSRAAEICETDDAANTKDLAAIIGRLGTNHDHCIDLLIRGAELVNQEPA